MKGQREKKGKRLNEISSIRIRNREKGEGNIIETREEERNRNQKEASAKGSE